MTSPHAAPTRVPPRIATGTGRPAWAIIIAEHPRERGHRANREVYPCGDDHQRHPDGYDGHDGGLGADVEEVVGGEEDGRGEERKTKTTMSAPAAASWETTSRASRAERSRRVPRSLRCLSCDLLHSGGERHHALL